METVWVAAEEKHCKEKEEGRVKDEKKALKKKKKQKSFKETSEEDYSGKKTDLQLGAFQRTGC